ncbi:MAG: hypothetical protein L6V84_03835 [Oscillospiraceae bacterium]|nr:MAG: hypothetical protein L6V84_03835 [Oscillospiraceae bacterium]
MGSFLDESKKGSLLGTVTAVRYIGFNDMLHSSNNISALVNSGKASAGKDSVICYGSIEGTAVFPLWTAVQGPRPPQRCLNPRLPGSGFHDFMKR